MEHALKVHDLFGAFFLLFQNDEDSVGKCEGKPQYIVNMRQFTINKTGGTVFLFLSEMTFQLDQQKSFKTILPTGGINMTHLRFKLCKSATILRAAL